ncbi:uncharacterized protein LTHEOB_2729 [Lasiodiplodia theobromae]|uniref:uncharacterized protein n=1 Tax=Lasiodiplodia theobromae TaxID=45133 RepID=UPI0015C3A21B|nr:uncharacterized protein LTHEOB_2729 [Lasiodiplodia theobromae]KAF4534754.1 hypothetical protein LTHEOB_2729 [Lasiodiplodia theobromae]
MPHQRTLSGTPLRTIPEDRAITITSAVDEAMIKQHPRDESADAFQNSLAIHLLEKKLVRLVEGKEHVRIKLQLLNLHLEKCRRELSSLRKAVYD